MRIIYANPLKKFRLGRLPDKRFHLIRTLVTQLVTHERIVTTTAKAKHMRSTVERIISMAKRIVNRRHEFLRNNIVKMVRTRHAQRKLLEEIVPRLAMNKGSCTRIVYIKQRRGDNASTSYIEILGK